MANTSTQYLGTYSPALANYYAANPTYGTYAANQPNLSVNYAPSTGYAIQQAPATSTASTLSKTLMKPPLNVGTGTTGSVIPAGTMLPPNFQGDFNYLNSIISHPPQAGTSPTAEQLYSQFYHPAPTVQGSDITASQIPGFDPLQYQNVNAPGMINAPQISGGQGITAQDITAQMIGGVPGINWNNITAPQMINAPQMGQANQISTPQSLADQFSQFGPQYITGKGQDYYDTQKAQLRQSLENEFFGPLGTVQQTASGESAAGRLGSGVGSQVIQEAAIKPFVSSFMQIDQQVAQLQAEEQSRVQDFNAQQYNTYVDRLATLRQSDAQNSLTAQQANQQAQLQVNKTNVDNLMTALAANQQAQLQTNDANAKGQLQAQQSNLEAQLQVAQANQKAAQEAATSNQSANLTAQQANMQAQLEAAKTNASNLMAALAANQQAQLQTNDLNVKSQLQTQQANLQAQLQVAQSNQKALEDAALANQQNTTQVSQANATLQAQFQQMAQQAAQAEAGRLSTVQVAQLEANMHIWETALQQYTQEKQIMSTAQTAYNSYLAELAKVQQAYYASNIDRLNVLAQLSGTNLQDATPQQIAQWQSAVNQAGG